MSSDLVVPGGNYNGGYYNGGYYGGAGVIANLGAMVSEPILGTKDDSFNTYLGAALIVVVLLVVAWQMGWLDSTATTTVASAPAAEGLAASHIGFMGEPSQASGFTNRRPARVAAAWAQHKGESFMNSRETPYFPDVTNRVLRMENREKEAIRALGKINQNRAKRAAAGDRSSGPLAWGPFWREWKQTHPTDGGSEGFSSKQLNPY